MKLLVLITILGVQMGCSGLIVRDDDTALATTSKVSTRIVLGVATLGISELAVQQRKNEEACDRQGGYLLLSTCLSPGSPAPNLAPLMFMPYLFTPPPPQVLLYEPRPPMQFFPPPNQLNCTTSIIGNQQYTHCY